MYFLLGYISFCFVFTHLFLFSAIITSLSRMLYSLVSLAVCFMGHFRYCFCFWHLFMGFKEVRWSKNYFSWRKIDEVKILYFTEFPNTNFENVSFRENSLLITNWEENFNCSCTNAHTGSLLSVIVHSDTITLSSSSRTFFKEV